VDASSKTAHYNLRKGRSILIFVGGEKEQLLTTPGEHTIYLSGRKGFIKLALEYGTPLVPMVRSICSASLSGVTSKADYTCMRTVHHLPLDEMFKCGLSLACPIVCFRRERVL
jgi:Diacylglycerol acyltransferase